MVADLCSMGGVWDSRVFIVGWLVVARGFVDCVCIG